MSSIAKIEDWSSMVSFQPNMVFRPERMDALRDFLQGVANGFIPAPVRTPGSLHSCAPLVEAGTVLDVSGLPRELAFDDNESAVVVTANWRLHDFLLELSKHGKSTVATGGMDHQTLAGLISTNTAPATRRYRMYDAVDWIEYLTIEGKSVVERRVHKDDPAFRCVVGSLGAIGVLTRLRLRPVEERFFATLQEVIPIMDVLADVEATSARYDFWRIDWVPGTDEGLLWCAWQIPKEQAAPDGDYPADATVNAVQHVFNLWDKLSDKTAGPLLDDVMSLAYRAMMIFYGKTKASGPLRNMLPVDRNVPLRVAMAEWSFDPAHLPRIIDACRAYFGRRGWPNIPIEIELSKTDDVAMSAWSWKGLDCIVKLNFMYLTSICDAREKALIFTHLRGLWDWLVESGIPFKAHWGKINFMDPAFVKRNFDLAAFREHVHPAFVNRYLAERIGA